MPLLDSLPLLLVGLTTVVLGVLVLRALRDETVLEALRAEVRLVGETHRAVTEARTVGLGVDGRPRPLGRPRG